MKYRFIREHKPGASVDHDVPGTGRFGQQLFCLETATGACQIADEQLSVRIGQVHEATHQIYGCRCIGVELAEQGNSSGRKRVVRLMCKFGLQGHRRHL